MHLSAEAFGSSRRSRSLSVVDPRAEPPGRGSGRGRHSPGLRALRPLSHRAASRSPLNTFCGAPAAETYVIARATVVAALLVVADPAGDRRRAGAIGRCAVDRCAAVLVGTTGLEGTGPGYDYALRHPHSLLPSSRRCISSQESRSGGRRPRSHSAGVKSRESSEVLLRHHRA